jgi:urease accessory protein
VTVGAHRVAGPGTGSDPAEDCAGSAAPRGPVAPGAGMAAAKPAPDAARAGMEATSAPEAAGAEMEATSAPEAAGAGSTAAVATPATAAAGMASGGADPGSAERAGRVANCGGLTATASVVVDVDAGRSRIRWTQAWPIVLRSTGDARVHLVHGAGGPLGGDVLALQVRVGASATLAVRSAGATIVQPGRGPEPARWDFDVVVGAGASLDWAPEPTVVTAGADYRTSLRVDLAAGARAVVREVVVLGRHGSAGGRYRGRLDVTIDGHPLLAHTTSLDGEDPALRGPGGTAGARAVGTLVVAGAPSAAAHADSLGGERPDVRWAWTDLAGPGRALFAVGEPGAVIALLAAAAADLTRGGQPGRIAP